MLDYFGGTIFFLFWNINCFLILERNQYILITRIRFLAMIKIRNNFFISRLYWNQLSKKIRKTTEIAKRTKMFKIMSRHRLAQLETICYKQWVNSIEILFIVVNITFSLFVSTNTSTIGRETQGHVLSGIQLVWI